MELSTEAVEELFKRCLSESADQGILVQGITLTAAFEPQKLEDCRQQIADLLDELPEPFKESAGGGWSFLNACNDKHGRQWTSFHRAMDMLFMLGTAAGLVKLLLPRDMWDALPGGMPYFVVLDRTEAKP